MGKRKLWIVLLGVLVCVTSFAAKKKKDDETQTLALPKDPPMVAIGDSTRLVFHVSPLSGKGLLSQQTRDALHAILKANGSAQVIHLRAFVAGSGDLRRVPQIVSEVFTKEKQPLPSVSVIQAGALPLEDAQIVIEAVSEARRPVKCCWRIRFLAATEPEKLSSPVAATCFVSDVSTASALVSRFPGIPVDVVQTERVPARSGVAMPKSVARGSGQPGWRLPGTRRSHSGRRKRTRCLPSSGSIAA